MNNEAYINGIYREIPGRGYHAPAVERVELLRFVSKSLIKAMLPLERRRAIILDLQADFGIKLSEHGLEQFMGE